MKNEIFNVLELYNYKSFGVVPRGLRNKTTEHVYLLSKNIYTFLWPLTPEDLTEPKEDADMIFCFIPRKSLSEFWKKEINLSKLFTFSKNKRVLKERTKHNSCRSQ